MGICGSFSRDDLIVDDGDVSLVPVEADLVTQGEFSSLAVAERQGQLVVLSQGLVSLASLHRGHCWVLGVQP